MAYDAHKNLAYSTVATAPSPATSGTSLTVATGDGAKFPTPPFNATVWPANSQPTTGNAEIVRVSAIATDTLTIARTQEGTSARAIGVGDQVAATVTAKMVTDIEAAAPNALVTSLPVSPGNGQVIFYQADATNGIVWQLRYNNDSASTYKWEYVGGGFLRADVDTADSASNTAYGDLTHVGPSVTAPLAGDWDIRASLDGVSAATSSASLLAAVKLGIATTVDTDRVCQVNSGGTSNQGGMGGRSIVRTLSSAGTVLKLQYRVTVAVSFTVEFRSLLIRPVRVG